MVLNPGSVECGGFAQLPSLLRGWMKRLAGFTRLRQ